MHPSILIRHLILCLLPLGMLVLAGCNLFTSMHSDGKESNSHILVADGKAAMSRGDYVKAAEYFRLAAEHNPRDSEARVGYAEAFLKAQGFSLGAFVNTLFELMNESDGGSSSSDFEFVVPENWGVTTLAEVDVILQTLITVLDPIALNQTDGPYQYTDANINLHTGLFYIMRVSVQMQDLGSAYSIQFFNKTDDATSISGWGLDPTLLAQLSDDFMWIVDGSDIQPSLFFINSLYNNMNTGIDRLQTAAQNSSSEDLINDFIDMFDDWETLASQ